MQKCNSCSLEKEVSEFTTNNKTFKECNECRAKRYCEHGTRKDRCINCSPKSFCEHKKLKSRCKTCKSGSAICKHGKEKYFCVECKGAGICEHKVHKRSCKKCGGSALCEHGKDKYYCKACGTNYCEHGVHKRFCKSCNGTGICEHGEVKYYCRTCKGAGICEHNNYKRYCVQCKGSSICIHNKIINHCSECNGSSMCEHKKLKSMCKDCNGVSICEHDKLRTRCNICNGGSICEHNKRRDNCVDCSTPEKLCEHCNCAFMSRNTIYQPYCFRCFCIKNPDADVSRQYKLKELYLQKELINTFNTEEKYVNMKLPIIFDKTVGLSGKRPDVFIDLGSHSIIIECDENQHKDYNCENLRIIQLFNDLQNRPMVMIRFNPDKYININNEKIHGCFQYKNNKFIGVNTEEWELRYIKLIEILDFHLNNIPIKEITMEYLYYDYDVIC